MPEALEYARVYGCLHAANHDGTYHAEVLERRLTERAATELQNVLAGVKAGQERHVCFVATELYENQGHSSVVERWLKLFADINDHSLIVTESVADGFLQRIVELGIPVKGCGQSGVERIGEILRLASGATHIVLHIHPHDIEAAVAAHLLRQCGMRCLFYNHADHLFSFGISAADTVCELSLFGEAVSRRSERASNGSVFLGIPLNRPDLSARQKSSGNASDRKTILTCGSPWKYAPANGLSFAEVADQLLERQHHAQLQFVGPTGTEEWARPLKDKWSDRITFHGGLAKVDYLQRLSNADVYLDSIPITGGSAFPEALLAGIPVVGLQMPISGYSSADLLRMTDVESLCTRVGKILDGEHGVLEEIEGVRTRVASEQLPASFRRRVEQVYLGENINQTGIKMVPGMNSEAFDEAWEAAGTVAIESWTLKHASAGVRFYTLGVLFPLRKHFAPGQFVRLIRLALRRRRTRTKAARQCSAVNENSIRHQAKQAA